MAFCKDLSSSTSASNLCKGCPRAPPFAFRLSSCKGSANGPHRTMHSDQAHLYRFRLWPLPAAEEDELTREGLRLQRRQTALNDDIVVWRRRPYCPRGFTSCQRRDIRHSGSRDSHDATGALVSIPPKISSSISNTWLPACCDGGSGSAVIEARMAALAAADS